MEVIMKKIVVLLMVLFSTNAYAFRCGNDIITNDYNKMAVAASCGQPEIKDRVCIQHHSDTGVCVNYGEIWYYNCGDGDYIYALTFGENGNFLRESMGGHGRGQSQCKGR
jgi:hypothetical protein